MKRMDPSSDPLTDVSSAPASRLWWMVPAAAFLLLIVVAMIIGPPPEPGGKGTSYDASAAGFRAAYLILEELKYPVERSRMATGGAVRWVLDPTDDREKDIANLDAWVRRGGVALLATEDAEFAAGLGLTIRSQSSDGGIVSATGLGVGSLDVGSKRVDLVNPAGRPWEGVRENRRGGNSAPLDLVSMVPHGRGTIWFLHRPAILRNGPMRKADNAVFACRLADAMLEDRSGRLAFDEFYHGLRDRPSVSALLFRPPMLAVTLQALGLTALVLWAVVPRFGPIRPAPPPNRRSKEEFLDAVAELLRRKGDYADAFGTVQQDLRRKLEAELGCTADMPAAELAREAERRRGVPADRIRDMLMATGPPGGTAAFITALHNLDTLRHDLFDRRP